jgi:signal transduction histidine kinase
VPLYRLDGELFGTLCSLDPNPTDVSEDDLELFQLFANLIAYELDADDKARQREAELEKITAESESQRRFMSILGHDLRNPLSTITMAASLQRRENLSPEKNLEMAEKIVKTAKRMQYLIEDLLETTQSMSGIDINIVTKPIDLSRICRGIVEEFKISHPDAKIEFYNEGNCFGEWDERRIGQILANLVSNAVSYGKSEMPIKVNLTEDYDRVIIQVNNRGDIISDEAKQHLFTAFWRGSKKGGDNSSGLGLGLYIVKRIVEAHRGTISVESNHEDGTTFTVIFEKATKPNN